MTEWIGRRRIASMADPVAGTLQVTAASYPPAGVSARYSNYQLTGVVSGPGLPPTAVQQGGIARVSQWPQPGAVLPVTVDRAQPDRFVIAWDQVPGAAEQALADARDLAVHEQTNLDFAVMRDAIDQAGHDPAAADRAPEASGFPEASGSPEAQPGLGVPPGPADAEPAALMADGHPLAAQPQTARPQDVPVPGSVVAVYPVPAPADLAPPGGIWDLSVRTAERTVLVRASFGSEDERARVAAVGAAVTVVLSGTADVGTLAG